MAPIITIIPSQKWRKCVFERESKVCFQPLFVARRAGRAAVTGLGAGASGTFTAPSDVGVSVSTPTVGAWISGLSVCKQRTSYRKVMVSRNGNEEAGPSSRAEEGYLLVVQAGRSVAYSDDHGDPQLRWSIS